MKSAGKMTTISRTIPEFKNLVLDGNFSTYIYSDTTPRLELTAGEYLLSDISSYISGDTLIIRDESSCDFMKGYKEKKITLSVDSLNCIQLLNNADLFSEDTLRFGNMCLQSYSLVQDVDLCINASYFVIRGGNSACTYKVRGKVRSFSVSMAGLSRLEAGNLQTEYTFVHSGTMGDCYINASKRIIAHFDDIGNVYYTGNPEIIKEERTARATGKLIPYNEN